MRTIKFLIFIGVLGVSFLTLRSCYDAEIRREMVSLLPTDKINSVEYPWSPFLGLVTQVSNYKEAYDTDSIDWIAQFSLIPAEAQSLSVKLLKIPDSKMKYRCIISNANWPIKQDICNADQMISAGFKGYFYNPSLCAAGCKQTIIFWMNMISGEAYIIGSPDYD